MSVAIKLKSLTAGKYRPHLARIQRLAYDAKSWLFATNGNAAALVACARSEGRHLPTFSSVSAHNAFGIISEPRHAIAWHDLQAWLRERAVREPCPHCKGIGYYGPDPCDFCDGACSLMPVDVSRLLGCPLDRELVATYLAPFYSPRVLVSPGDSELPGRATLFRAADDSWRVYVMPVRWLEASSWFPLGSLEAA